MIQLQKKQVKIVSIVIAVIFIGSVVALALTQTGNIASAASSSTVGVIDLQQVMAAHPGRDDANKQMQALQEEVDKDFKEKTAGMSTEEEKADYAQQCQKRIQTKYAELLESMMATVETATKKVADKKGLAVVLEKSAVVYGGQDITQDVIAELGKK